MSALVLGKGRIHSYGRFSCIDNVNTQALYYLPMDEKYSLQGIHFEWDSEKEKANQKKHSISFISACESFFDPFLMPFDDETEGNEVRYSVVGMTIK
ncbi:MAG: BrnT family toxin [Chloroflexi bacterium]|nr:BrnT family toxin [Chloroflexota bacterium]